MSKFIRIVIHHLGNFLRGTRLIYLRATGIEIGANTMISLHAKIDVRRGKVIIGDNCHITYGCLIISHDGASKQIDLDDDGEGFVKIGNNVFVGVNSVVLRNVEIGDNSVIGAGAVVTRSIPPNVIASGNPARVRRELTADINKEVVST